MAADHVVDEWSIPDDLWDCMRELIPERKNTHPFGGGKPPTPDRICMEAILFVLRTGCQWKGLDWSWLAMDGRMTKAPRGGEKDREKPHRPGQKGRQAQPAGRGGRHPGRPGRGRRQ